MGTLLHMSHTHSVILCAGDIRLVGGSDPLEGRVDLFYEGEWGQVVAHRGTNAANFACRQAGYLYSEGIQSFVQGNGSVWLYTWIYSGDEQRVESCTTMAGGSTYVLVLTSVSDVKVGVRVMCLNLAVE